MTNEDLHHRYALALARVPDPNVAGELFMDARDETDLLRRIHRWSRRTGEPLLEGPELPGLEDWERDHADHLARRGRRRRASRLSGAILSVLAAAAALSLTLADPTMTGGLGVGRVRAAAVLSVDPQHADRPVLVLRSLHPVELLELRQLVTWLNHARVIGHYQSPVWDDAQMGQERPPELEVSLSDGRTLRFSSAFDCDAFLTQDGVNRIVVTCNQIPGQLVVLDSAGGTSLRLEAPQLQTWLQGMRRQVDP